MRDYLLSLLEGVWSLGRTFGPFSDTLSKVTDEQATWRPGPDVHSIHEIVSHAAFWTQAFLDLIEGRPLDDRWKKASDGEVPPGVPTDWTAFRDAFISTRGRFVDAISRLSDEQVMARVANVDRTVADLVRSEVLHESYHLGEIAVMLQLQRA